MDKNIVIVDIDGTLSIVGDRLKYLQQSPKDWDAFYNACGEDAVNEDVAAIVESLYAAGNCIVLLTGRRKSCKEATVDWLNKHNIPWTGLLMRKDQDYRHDTVVKPELLEGLGIPIESVLCILEDRNSMVQKWRELGFTCLQVADGDF